MATLAMLVRGNLLRHTPDLPVASGRMEDTKRYVSELERQLEEYKRRERRYSCFLQATNAAVWEWDMASDTTEWKDGLYSLFGYPSEHRTTFEWWSSRIHPDDGHALLSSVTAVLESSERTWMGEYRFRRNDGSYAWVLDRAYIERDEHGKARTMLGAMLDITDRKYAEEALRRSEQRFQRLRDANVIGIVTADAEKIYDANDAFLKLVGYSREDMKAGRLRWLSLVAPEYHDSIERALRELAETGLMQAHAKEYVRKDGSRISVIVGGAVSEATPLCAILFVVDVSEVKELEKRLHEARKWETIGVLAGGVAHDFNNLLTTITVSATMTRDMLAPDHSGRRYLDYVVESSEKAAKLTSQLLAYAGKGAVVPQPTNLSGLVRDLDEQIRAAVPQNIDLSLELQDDIPDIEADPRQMEQVVITLLVNAAEAIGENAGRISVRTRLENVTGVGPPPITVVGELTIRRYLVLEVEDTGHGMTPETAAKVFDPFYSTKFPGRGLGLAAVAGVVRRSKGAIQIISEPQRGTLFRVFLPAI